MIGFLVSRQVARKRCSPSEKNSSWPSFTNGKLLSEVLGQVRYTAKYFYYYGGMADKIQGSVIPNDKPKVFNYTRYEPVGYLPTSVNPLKLVPFHACRQFVTGQLLEIGSFGNSKKCVQQAALPE